MPTQSVSNTETGRNTRPETVRVWDPFVRIFHWSLVILFALAWMTEDLQSLHQPVGYAILGLLALRIVWGVSVPGMPGSPTSSARPAPPSPTSASFSRARLRAFLAITPWPA